MMLFFVSFNRYDHSVVCVNVNVFVTTLIMIHAQLIKMKTVLICCAVLCQDFTLLFTAQQFQFKN